jgi:hypothetical protein
MVKRPRWATGIATSAVLVATVGIGVATGASAARHYKACATHAGVLTLETHGHCLKGSKPVSLGARGPKGAAGTSGKTGPSNVYGYYYVFSTGTGIQTGQTPPPTDGTLSPTLLTLPAGSYVLRWDMSAFGASSGEASCVPSYTTGSAPRVSSAFIIFHVGSADPGGASYEDALVVKGATQVTVKCDLTAIQAPAGFQSFDVTATQTGSLHATGFTPQ